MVQQSLSCNHQSEIFNLKSKNDKAPDECVRGYVEIKNQIFISALYPPSRGSYPTPRVECSPSQFCRKQS